MTKFILRQIGLVFIALILSAPFSFIFAVEELRWITVPMSFLVWIVLTFIAFWVADNIKTIFEPLCRRYLKYTIISRDGEMNKWCKENSRGFWVQFDDIYYFADEEDSVAFKLRWL